MSGGRRVVIIDDSAVDLMLYRRILRRSGHFDDILAFAWAHEALDWLDAHADSPVDVILLDVNMPRMNGFEFLDSAAERLAGRFDACVVIMLTTSLDPEDVERAKGCAAVRGYVSKPLTLQLLDEVLTLLDDD